MRTPFRSALGAVLVAVAVAVAPAAATAAPADRGAALAAWQAVEQDKQVPAGWTGSVDGCDIGAESSESLAATLRTVNTMRDFAGVSPVTFDSDFNHKALAAALMMKAKGALSHDPGPDWPCYSDDGQDGAEHSNLFLGYSGAAAIEGYVDDAGIEGLGHRSFVLDRRLAVMGSGSTGTTNALYVTSPAHRVANPRDSMTAWPPPGFAPWQWIFHDWSVQIGGDGQNSTFQDPQVSVTADGQALSVSGVTAYGRELVWNVDLPSELTSADHVLHVTVSGGRIDGRDFPIAYDVKAFQTGPLPPAPLGFTKSPLIRRSDGRKARIKVGTRVQAVARVTGGRLTGYQWLRGGKAIKGAARSTYRVRKADRGKRLAVRVRGASADGARTITATSPRVRVAK